MDYLFAYGTLQLERVQMANFGRVLRGRADKLVGYTLDWVEITDPKVLATSGQQFHPILRFTGFANDEVQGTLFEVSEADLVKADAYEVSAYERVSARTQSGLVCWVYQPAEY